MNKKKKILVTSSGGDIGINIINILLKQKNFPCEIIATDIKDIIFNRVDVDYFYKVPKTNDNSYFGVINNIILKNKIDLVIPASEQDIKFFDLNREIFSEKVELLINNSTIIKSFLDKEVTSRLLTSINISVPKTLNLESYHSFEGDDVIVKAGTSSVSKKIIKVKSQKELDGLRKDIDHLDQYIVQEYIGTEDEEFTTAVYRDDNIFEVISFRRKLDGDKTGYAEVYKSSLLESYAKKIAEYTDLKGSMNIQSRKYNDDFFIFEINPRISSTVYIRDHFNFNDLIWWCCYLLKVKFEKSKEVEESGVAVIGYIYNFYENKA